MEQHVYVQAYSDGNVHSKWQSRLASRVLQNLRAIMISILETFVSHCSYQLRAWGHTDHPSQGHLKLQLPPESDLQPLTLMCAQASTLLRHPRSAGVLPLKHLKGHKYARDFTVFELELAAAAWSQVQFRKLFRIALAKKFPIVGCNTCGLLCTWSSCCKSVSNCPRLVIEHSVIARPAERSEWRRSFADFKAASQSLLSLLLHRALGSCIQNAPSTSAHCFTSNGLVDICHACASRGTCYPVSGSTISKRPI